MKKSKTDKVLLLITLAWFAGMAAFTVNGVNQALSVAERWELTLGPTIGLAAIFAVILGGVTLLSSWVLHKAATEPIENLPAH